jgi:hypothetical protein
VREREREMWEQRVPQAERLRKAMGESRETKKKRGNFRETFKAKKEKRGPVTNGFYWERKWNKCFESGPGHTKSFLSQPVSVSTENALCYFRNLSNVSLMDYDLLLDRKLKVLGNRVLSGSS